MNTGPALVAVAVVTAANMVWCAAVWWRLRRLRDEGAVLAEAARRLDEAVERARAALEGLRAELVASERAVELRSREARARAAELARLLEAARRTGRPGGRPGRPADGVNGHAGDAAPIGDDPAAVARPDRMAGPAAAHVRAPMGTAAGTAAEPAGHEPEEIAVRAAGARGGGPEDRAHRPPGRHGRAQRAAAAAEDILRALAGMR